MLIFVGFCQIADVPDSFAVSKGAVCIDKAIVLILVNLRICTDCTTQIGLVVVWSMTGLDWYFSSWGFGGGLLIKDVLYRLTSITGIEGFSEQETVRFIVLAWGKHHIRS